MFKKKLFTYIIDDISLSTIVLNNKDWSEKWPSKFMCL